MRQGIGRTMARRDVHLPATHVSSPRAFPWQEYLLESLSRAGKLRLQDIWSYGRATLDDVVTRRSCTHIPRNVYSPLIDAVPYILKQSLVVTSSVFLMGSHLIYQPCETRR